MELNLRLKQEWEQARGLYEWSECLETRAGERVCILNIPSYLSNDGYPLTALIDYGSEFAVEFYNENGEWNVGKTSPLDIVLKTT